MVKEGGGSGVDATSWRWVAEWLGGGGGIPRYGVGGVLRLTSGCEYIVKEGDE